MSWRRLAIGVFIPLFTCVASGQVRIPAANSSPPVVERATWMNQLSHDASRPTKAPYPPAGCTYAIEAPDSLFLVGQKAVVRPTIYVWQGSYSGNNGWEPNFLFRIPTDTAIVRIVGSTCERPVVFYADYGDVHLRLPGSAFVEREQSVFNGDQVHEDGVFVFLRKGGALHRAGIASSCDTCAVRVVDGDSIVVAKEYEDQAPERARIAAIRAAPYTSSVKERLIAKKVWIGMTAKQARLSWGEPGDVNVTVTVAGRHEQWVYGDGNYVYVENGIVTAVQK